MNLPASSVELSNGTLKLDARYCLQNCSILMPEINTTLNGTIGIKLDGFQNESIRGLNNDRALNVTGMYLKVPDTAAILSPGTILARNTELNVPDVLSAKDINLSLGNNTSKVVSGSISLGRSYVFVIRDAALNLPPGSVVRDESYLQRLNYSAAGWNTKYMLPLASFSGIAESLFSWIVRIFALAFGLWLLYILSSRFLELIWHKPRSLVVNSFAKTGIKEIDDSLDSLSQITRERLAESLLSLQGIIEKHAKEQGPGTFDIREFKPLPDSLKKKGLSDLVSSLKSASPGQSFPLLSFIDLSSVSNILFPPKGIEISCFPQRKGKDPEVLGISFKLSDLSEKQESVSFTCWEKAPGPDKKPISDDEALVYKCLIQYLDAAGELQRARTYQKELLASCKADKVSKNKAELKELDEKILWLEAASRLFALGRKLEAQDAEGAIDCYLDAFKEAHNLEDRRSSDFEAWTMRSLEMRMDWEKVIANPQDANYKKSLSYIVENYWDAGLQKEASEILSIAQKRFIPNGASGVSSLLDGKKSCKAERLTEAARTLNDLGRPNDAKEIVKKALELSPEYKAAKDLSREIDRTASTEIRDMVIQERYIELLKPAARRLAAEVSRFWMMDYLLWDRSHIWKRWLEWPYISKISNANKDALRDEAAVNNFFGALYTSYGNKDSMLYNLAEADLKRACKLYGEWYLPHENLGFLYYIKGLNETDKEKSKELVHKSLIEYQRALTERESSLPRPLDKKDFAKHLSSIKSIGIPSGRIAWFGIGGILGLLVLGGLAGGIFKAIAGLFGVMASAVVFVIGGARSILNDTGVIWVGVILFGLMGFIAGVRLNGIIGNGWRSVSEYRYPGNLTKNSLPKNDQMDIIRNRIAIGWALACYYIEKEFDIMIDRRNKSLLSEAIIQDASLKEMCKGCTCKDCIWIEGDAKLGCLKVTAISRIIRRYKSPRYIYNLACYFARRAKLDGGKHKNDLNCLSISLLTISLALDRIDGNLANLFQADPDLDEVSGKLSDAKFTLLLNLAENGDDLAGDTGEIINILCPAFKKINWAQLCPPPNAHKGAQ